MNDTTSDDDDGKPAFYDDLEYEIWRDRQIMPTQAHAHAHAHAHGHAHAHAHAHVIEPNALDAVNNHNKNHKRCLKCKVYKPIREFTLPRHRLCAKCRANSPVVAVERAAAWFAAHPPPIPGPSPAEVWAAHKQGFPLTTEFGPAKIPALTMTREGRRKYNRERARAIRAGAEATAQAFGQSTTGSSQASAHTPKYAQIKLCARCHQKKHVSHFGHPRFRVCLSCDGPPMG